MAHGMRLYASFKIFDDGSRWCMVYHCMLPTIRFSQKFVHMAKWFTILRLGAHTMVHHDGIVYHSMRFGAHTMLKAHTIVNVEYHSKRKRRNVNRNNILQWGPDKGLKAHNL